MPEAVGKKSPVIETGFRLRMWWLTLIRRYKVLSIKRIPKSNVFGEIYYKNVWVVSKDRAGAGQARDNLFE